MNFSKSSADHSVNVYQYWNPKTKKTHTVSSKNNLFPLSYRRLLEEALNPSPQNQRRQ